MSWLPQLVGVMWEVLQKLRGDRQSVSRELHTAKVPTPTLARQHCRWCQILEEDQEKEDKVEEEEETVYETVELARLEVKTDSASLEQTYSLVVRHSDRDRDRQRERERGRDRERAKARERERTYGEVREREGRTRERQVETDWRGRSPERRWRGRSPSTSRRSEGEARQGGGWEPGGWTGRVVTGDFVEPSRGAEWRGRSPGITGEHW